MRLKTFIILVLLVQGSFYSLSQQLLLPPAIEEIIEEIASNAEEDADLSAIIDDLYFLWENPINLNNTTLEELSRIYVLNVFQIINLLEYVRIFGPVSTMFELSYIEGFSPDIILKIAPFVKLVETPTTIAAQNILRFGRHQVFTRMQQVLEEQKGFSEISDSALAASPNSRFLGSNLKLNTRYQFSYRNRIFWGFTAEKDAGEEFFNGNNPHGFDYKSAHFFIRGNQRIKSLALGDFHVRLGQGLILWPGFSQGKSANVVNIKKAPRGLLRYSSTDENIFLRGAGTSISVSEKLELTVFFSRKKIDANVSSIDSLTNAIIAVSSIQNTGLHATPSQVNTKNVLGETITGGNLTWKGNFLEIGLTGVYYKYDAQVIPSDLTHNKFEFRGGENFNVGADYRLFFRNIKLFGEGALSQSGGYAFVTGLLADAGPRVTLATLYRNYSRNYHAYFSNGFGEGARTINETGFYTGIVLLPLPRWKLSAYFDVFSFPWLRFRAFTPTAGYDYLLQADFTPSGTVSMYFRMKRQTKPENAPVQEPFIRQTENIHQTNFRYQIGYRISPSLEFRNRIELSYYESDFTPRERGFLLYQDIIFRSNKIPFNASFRYALIDTDSFNTRIYAFENDVLYAFSVPAYFDTGSRFYLNLNYSFPAGLDLWFRIAQTNLPNRTSMGSGLNEITGNTRTEVKLQARITF